MTDKNAECACGNASGLVIAVLGALAGAGVGALIFYLASRPRTQAPVLAGYSHAPLYRPVTTSLPAPDLTPLIDEIRAHIRAGNAGTPGEAATALALLEDAERRHGAALAEACDPARLRALIERVRTKNG